MDVAIVGYAARLPGAATADAAWDILREGRCTVSQIPADRFSTEKFYDPTPNTLGKSYTFRAGVISDPFHFDAAAFGITPLEARQMDPQQRILLETTLHAFEHAGINPNSLSGTSAGVYVGSSSADHSAHAMQDARSVEAHFMLGNTLSILANRISFQWNLRGPSFAIDTACSSGLVAFDKAVEDLKAGKIETAIVAGTNLLLSPLPFIGFSQARMLSPDGLCRPFSDAANGYVRSEGVVVFILRRADVAIDLGDQIRSSVIGSATNTDGRKSGITYPSKDIQKLLLNQCLDNFQIDPDEVVLFEAHGTGTPVGDPVEAMAIGLSYGQRRNAPLAIGSAKGNFGHLEPASGLVGLLKAQMALENRLIPATLHAEALNSSIDFDALNIVVQRTNVPIEPKRDRIVAAVNSFGFGGANAHVVVQRNRSMGLLPTDPKKIYPALRISAASEAPLRSLAQTWKERMLAEIPLPAEAIMNVNYRTALRQHRLCVPAGSAREMAKSVENWLENSSAGTALSGQAYSNQAKVGFVFAGNGAVWDGMARDIYAVDPSFRQSLQRSGRVFRQLGGIDICKTLFADDLRDRLGPAETDQSLLFAIQIALVAALRARGLLPHGVTGHSVGEVAAAVTSGAISIKTGAQIILARSRRLEALRGSGTMAALAANEKDVSALVKRSGLNVEIAAMNSNSSVTVSGSIAEIDQLLQDARSHRIAGRRLRIDYPYHSSALDQLELELRSDLNAVVARSPRIPFFAGCTGSAFDAPLDGDFWWANARNPVQFANAVGAMCAAEIGVMIEISPSTVLQSYLRDVVRDNGGRAAVLSGLTQSSGATRRDAEVITLDALAHGAAMDEARLLGQNSRVASTLPPYPFERTEYRLTYESGINAIGGTFSRHPLLGEKLVADGAEWRNELSVGKLDWTRDHTVHGQIVLPATAIVEMFRAAADQILTTQSFSLTDLTFQRPVVLSETTPLCTRVIYEASLAKLTLQSRSGGGWQPHATGRIFQTSIIADTRVLLDSGDNPKRLYRALSAAGLNYGRAFRRMQSVAVSGDDIDVRLKGGFCSGTYGMDPVLADAALHAIAIVVGQFATSEAKAYLPTRIDNFQFYAAEPIAGARLHIVDKSHAQIMVDVTYVDATGAVVAVINGLSLTSTRNETAPQALVWEEVLVPVVSKSADIHTEIIARKLMHERPPADDHETLRAAIGGRLAWDLMRDANASEISKNLARNVLTSAKLSEIEISDAASPWPELEILVDLFAKAVPTASDDLQSVLDTICETKPARIEVARLSDAVYQTFMDVPLSNARVALVGQVDPGLATAIARLSGYTLLILDTADAAAAMTFQIPDEAALSMTAIGDVSGDQKFDIVVGIDLVRSCAKSNFSKYKSLLAPKGQFHAFEEASDAFSLMTGRHAPANLPSDMAQDFLALGLSLEKRFLTNMPLVEVWVGARRTTDAAAKPDWEVIGEGPIADALRAGSDVGGPKMSAIVLGQQDDIWSTSIQVWKTFQRAVASDHPVWIIQEGANGNSALRGWRRSFANELKRDFRTASVASGTDAEFVALLLAATHEQELVFDGETAKSPRLRRGKQRRNLASSSMVLAKSSSAGGSGTEWQAVPRVTPTDTEIEVAVAATGLNFRDLMWAKDLLPIEAMTGGFSGPTLGMECSGTVLRAGHNSGFEVGQRVLLVAPAAFASHVTIASDCAIALPADLDLVTAAGLPVATMTALYALREVAALQASETVLIHAATGGVGLAAVQIAKSVGAKIIATAGTPKKRAFLKVLGVTDVFDSRSLAFANQVRNATGGRGVDVVLNSLSGPAMELSVGCLAPFGRFVELGKRDYFANTALPLRPFRKNISYFGVDIDQLFDKKPVVVKRLFQEIKNQFAKSDLDISPTQVFPSDGVDDAFSRMQSGFHIGKIVVTPPSTTHKLNKQVPKPVRGTWLVVGGTGGFGLETAKWLVRQGAETLWLVSKSGETADSVLADLKEVPAQVHIRQCDVCDPVQVQNIVSEITSVNGKLSGVVHAAMILRDMQISDLDEADISAVMAPKILGAENLDVMTRDHKLDHFLLFGSVAARFGSVGQAPYVAANLALEEIAARRHSQGVPALTVAWGPIGDAGYLAREGGVRELIQAELGPCMNAKTALSCLAELLSHGVDTSAVTIAPNVTPAMTLPVTSGRLYSDVRRKASFDSTTPTFDFASIIVSKGEDAARKLLLEIMCDEAARIMRISPNAVDTARPLNEIGFDSLMGVNFFLGLEKHFAQSIAFPDGNMDLTLQELAKTIMDIAKPANTTASSGLAERHLSSTKLSQSELDKINSQATRRISSK